MKPMMLFAAAALPVAAVIGLAAPASAQDVRIRNAVARVVVIVEDRTDIGVEIEPGRSNLPALRVERDGSNVRIDGGLRRGRMGGSMIRNCHSGSGGAQPGDGASVEVRDAGRVALSDAPLIVIRSPRDVDVSAGGAVFGAIGRGARSIELTSGGCGDWTVANTDGELDVTIGGSGSVRAGTSGRLDGTIGGSGTLIAGATRELDVTIGGSGEARVARVDGPVSVLIGGSGDLSVREGSAPRMSITIGGSGNIDFGGTARDVSVTIGGSGDVRIAEVTGNLSRTVAGSGDIRIGR